MCKALLVSRSGYYGWLRRQAKPGRRARENRLLAEQIEQAFAQHDGRYGSPRIAQELGRPGQRHRIARLMRVRRLQARPKRRYRVVTTNSRHAFPVADLILPTVKVTRVNQAWACDVTHILTRHGWMYLAGILDLHSRRIVGWAMGQALDAPLVIAALQMAIKQRRPKAGTIIHSDRGANYASHAYRQALAQYGLIASMSRKGNCYDNAFIESFWSTLKAELGCGRRHYDTIADARSAIFQYIEGYYNRRRLHSALGYRSPLDFEAQLN
jgi:putative transposase